LPEPYRLRVAGPAVRALERMPERVAPALVEFMTGQLLDNPQRIGKPLVGRFAGLYAARCGTTGSGTASKRAPGPSWSCT